MKGLDYHYVWCVIMLASSPLVCQGKQGIEIILGVVANKCLHQAEKMDLLETEKGWREEEFDYILQLLRTVLLKRLLTPQRQNDVTC